jgi:hypothetical protein
VLTRVVFSLALLVTGPDTTRAADPAAQASPIQRETFSVTYTITIRERQPTVAHIRWTLSGIDEIERIRLRADPSRYTDFEASGALEYRRNEIVWTPGGPYAELGYTAAINHRRAPNKGFDSYGGDGWVLSRTSDLFPRCAALFRRDVEPSPESRARLVLRVPHDWDAATVFPPDGPYRYVVENPHHRFDHPYGWILLGHMRRTDVEIAGTSLTIALAPGVTVRPEPIQRLLQQTLSSLTTLFDRPLSRLLIVIGPDPMWRGGLSGEASLYMHGSRKLRSPDRTSPYLHELFHVAAPFRPAADAHWVTEGLAEYYSLELQRRIGLLSDDDMAHAIALLEKHGLWGRDFTRTAAPALRNNSAPLVMYALDQQIRAATMGAHDLDAVVISLARGGGVVSTAHFLGTVERIAGQSFAEFFRRHVYHGEVPATRGRP